MRATWALHEHKKYATRSHLSVRWVRKLRLGVNRSTYVRMLTKRVRYYSNYLCAAMHVTEPGPPRDSLDHHVNICSLSCSCVPDASRRGRRIRRNAAEIGERWVYLLSHPYWRLIGDRSMHGARTCSSVQQCLELQVGGWTYHITTYTWLLSTRDFSEYTYRPPNRAQRFVCRAINWARLVISITIKNAKIKIEHTLKVIVLRTGIN